jgi:hypothetical protein
MNDLMINANQMSAIETAMEHLKAEREGTCGCDFCNWVRMMRRGRENVEQEETKGGGK